MPQMALPLSRTFRVQYVRRGERLITAPSLAEAAAEMERVAACFEFGVYKVLSIEDIALGSAGATVEVKPK